MFYFIMEGFLLQKIFYTLANFFFFAIPYTKFNHIKDFRAHIARKSFEYSLFTFIVRSYAFVSLPRSPAGIISSSLSGSMARAECAFIELLVDCSLLRLHPRCVPSITLWKQPSASFIQNACHLTTGRSSMGL